MLCNKFRVFVSRISPPLFWKDSFLTTSLGVMQGRMFKQLSQLNDQGLIQVVLRDGDVVAQWLVSKTWDLKVESSSPGRCTHVVFLGKTLNSHSDWEPANCLGQPDKMLGGDLQYTT